MIVTMMNKSPSKKEENGPLKKFNDASQLNLHSHRTFKNN